MSILDSDNDELLDALEPVEAACTDTHLTVTLANGQAVTNPLWKYPRLLNATPAQRRHYELSPFGIHWPGIDEDLSVRGLIKGNPAPGAVPPGTPSDPTE
ncbi:MAG: DUF2442 domain-containing protein [Alphaproteobacteria bacterium]|jgi:hypothetical protein|nr:DUF2442 domain-containing protein [Alphaproteobacteria bacterium]